MLLKAFRPAGPALQFKFPTSTDIILDRSIGNQTQVILVMGPPGPMGPGLTETFVLSVTLCVFFVSLVAISNNNKI